MSGLILFFLCIGLLSFLGWSSSGGGNTKHQDYEHRRIEQAKQDALNDIRRRRERAEDQLRRLSRWSR